jgi:hypothetical protein
MSQVYVYRSSLSGMHLKSVLMTVSTELEPQLDKILLGKYQYHSPEFYKNFTYTSKSFIVTFRLINVSGMLQVCHRDSHVHNVFTSNSNQVYKSWGSVIIINMKSIYLFTCM